MSCIKTKGSQGSIERGEHSGGAAARIFQLLILLQAPVILYFMAKWLPQFPQQAISVLLFHIAAAVSAVTLILVLEA